MSKKLGFIGILMAAVLVLAGCGSTKSEAQFSMSDIMFAQMMIVHHDQAIEMSELVPERTTNPKILDLAKRIEAAQGPEIEQMKSWLTSAGAGMEMGHSMAMPGLLSESEMSKLRAASGTVFDLAYLKGMIAHHEGAIMMADEVQNSKNPEVSALANAIIKAQTAEIKEMKLELASK